MVSGETWQHKWLMMSIAKKSLEVNECELGAETPAQLFISGGSVPLQSLGCVTAVPVFCLVSPTPAKLPEGQEEGLQGEK